MSVEKVKEFFDKNGNGEKIIEFSELTATVEMAANALGCEPKRIAKTMSFYTKEGAILVVMAGDAKTDNHKFKERFGEKPRMIPGDEVENAVGHAPGGVCPFAIREGVKVYLDESLKRFETVYPAAGSSHSAIELSLEALEKYSSSLGYVDVCKGWNEEENV